MMKVGRLLAVLKQPVLILADADSTVLSTRGFHATGDLTKLLEFHADKLRQADVVT